MRVSIRLTAATQSPTSPMCCYLQNVHFTCTFKCPKKGLEGPSKPTSKKRTSGTFGNTHFGRSMSSPKTNPQKKTTRKAKQRVEFYFDPHVYGNAVICGVFGQCRCQSAWMDGGTSCSWVFVCECACVHLYIISQPFGPFMINTQNAVFTN